MISSNQLDKKAAQSLRSDLELGGYVGTIRHHENRPIADQPMGLHQCRFKPHRPCRCIYFIRNSGKHLKLRRLQAGENRSACALIDFFRSRLLLGESGGSKCPRLGEFSHGIETVRRLRCDRAFIDNSTDFNRRWVSGLLSGLSTAGAAVGRRPPHQMCGSGPHPRSRKRFSLGRGRNCCSFGS